MSRRKTTIYLDDDLRAATKVVAASTDRSESDVVSDALRSYLRSADAQAAAEELKALMARVVERGEADEDEAMALAVAETRAVRRRARR